MVGATASITRLIIWRALRSCKPLVNGWTGIIRPVWVKSSSTNGSHCGFDMVFWSLKVETLPLNTIVAPSRNCFAIQMPRNHEARNTPDSSPTVISTPCRPLALKVFTPSTLTITVSTAPISRSRIILRLVKSS